MADGINYEILEDGTIKFTTDKISGPNHVSATKFMEEVARLAGGAVTVEKRNPHSHSHQHIGDHSHDNE